MLTHARVAPGHCGVAIAWAVQWRHEWRISFERRWVRSGLGVPPGSGMLTSRHTAEAHWLQLEMKQPISCTRRFV